jgi:hypothetical protein
MSRVSLRSALFALGVLPVLALLPMRALAQDKPAAATTVPETEEEKKEREVRRACAVALCSTLHNRKPDSGDVTCSVRKTWRKEHIGKILAKGKLSWPWGDARCSTDLKFDRATLVKAMSEKDYEAQFPQHQVSCELDRETEKYQVKLHIQPKVTFSDGKAVKAVMNWGTIEAPMLAKSALWSATAADNTFGVLQSTVVEDINDFIQNKCTDVKEEWQGK